MGKKENTGAGCITRFFLSCLHEGVLQNKLKLSVELWSQERSLLKNFCWNFPRVLLLLLMFKLNILNSRKVQRTHAGVLQDLSTTWQDVLPAYLPLQLLHQAAVEICSIWKSWGFFGSVCLGFFAAVGRALDWNKIKFHNIQSSEKWNQLLPLNCSAEQRRLPMWIRTTSLPTSAFELS